MITMAFPLIIAKIVNQDNWGEITRKHEKTVVIEDAYSWN
jgi:hypothetical protein